MPTHSVPALERLLTEHFQTWADDLTSEQVRAICDWQSPRHALLNELYRARALDPARAAEIESRLGTDTLVELAEAGVALAEACSLATAPFDFTVFRGINRAGYAAILDQLGYRSLRGGEVIVDAGFMATSIHDRFAHSRMGDAGGALLLELNVPAGKACAWIPAVHRASDQGELLFAPDTTLHVVRVWRLGQDTAAHVEIELG